MIAAGEVGGVLDIILQRLAEFLEKAARLKRRIISAMIYPAAVITVAGIIVLGIMILIVPKFIEIFDDFDTDMPALTVWLIEMSKWLGGCAAGVHGRQGRHHQRRPDDPRDRVGPAFAFRHLLCRQDAPQDLRRQGRLRPHDPPDPRPGPAGPQGHDRQIHPDPGHPGQRRRARSSTRSPSPPKPPPTTSIPTPSTTSTTASARATASPSRCARPRSATRWWST